MRLRHFHLFLKLGLSRLVTVNVKKKIHAYIHTRLTNDFTRPVQDESRNTRCGSQKGKLRRL